MPIICDECYSIYDREKIKFLGLHNCIDFCPQSKCSGKLIEVDDLLIDPVIEFWKLGYLTTYSCSGHIYGSNINNSYFGFQLFTEDDDFDLLNKTFLFKYREDKKIQKLFKSIIKLRKQNKKYKNIIGRDIGLFKNVHDGVHYRMFIGFSDSVKEIEKTEKWNYIKIFIDFLYELINELKK